MPRRLASMTVLLLLAQCIPFQAELDGLACDEGRCAPGYQCNPLNNRCEKEREPGACVPDGSEVCDGRDNDCNDMVDDALTADTLASACNARFANAHVAVWTCMNDCHAQLCEAGFYDLDGSGGCEYACEKKSAGEACNGEDDDCNGSVDEGLNASGCTTYYRDEDNDGFGLSDSRCTCAADALYRATVAGDCDDSPAGCGASCYPTNPAPDICDGLDQDCDSARDEDPEIVWYHDADGDGFASLQDTQALCIDPDGPGTTWLATPTTPDCDDSTLPSACGAQCFPGNSVIDGCNGFDNDCNGLIDDDVATYFYHDVDGDGFTSLTDKRLSCSDPDGTGTAWLGSATAPDCDDNDPISYPMASEVCDGNDNDCDGTIPTNERDLDNDKYVVCSGWNDQQGDNTAILGGLDCKDDDPLRHPNLSEVCDNRDNDCNNTIDNGLGVSCACTNGGAKKPLDICQDGIDNDCNQAIDEASCAARWHTCPSAYAYRKPLTLRNTSSLTSLFPGAPVKVVIDHDALVKAGKSRADGNDVRIFYAAGTGPTTEIKRVLDPASSWGSTTTTLWFALQSQVQASTTDKGYFVYYGDPGASAPGHVENDIFTVDFADFFDRPNSATVDNGWIVDTASGTTLQVSSNTLAYGGDAAMHSPRASRDCGGPFTGRMQLRFGFNFDYTDDADYRFYMQLGSNPNDPASDNNVNTSGVAVNLMSAAVWDEDEDPINPKQAGGFGYYAMGKMRQLDVVDGPATIEVITNPTAKTYTLRIIQGSNTRVYNDLPYAIPVSSVNTVRFMAHQLGPWTGARQIEWVMLRRYIDDLFTITVEDEQPNLC